MIYPRSILALRVFLHHTPTVRGVLRALRDVCCIAVTE